MNEGWLEKAERFFKPTLFKFWFFAGFYFLLGSILWMSSTYYSLSPPDNALLILFVLLPGQSTFVPFIGLIFYYFLSCLVVAIFSRLLKRDKEVNLQEYFRFTRAKLILFTLLSLTIFGNFIPYVEGLTSSLDIGVSYVDRGWIPFWGTTSDIISRGLKYSSFNLWERIWYPYFFNLIFFAYFLACLIVSFSTKSKAYTVDSKTANLNIKYRFIATLRKTWIFLAVSLVFFFFGIRKAFWNEEPAWAVFMPLLSAIRPPCVPPIFTIPLLLIYSLFTFMLIALVSGFIHEVWLKEKEGNNPKEISRKKVMLILLGILVVLLLINAKIIFGNVCVPCGESWPGLWCP